MVGSTDAGPVVPMTAAENVGADDEVPVWCRSAVPGPTISDHQPGLPVTGFDVGDMLVTGQRVADEDGVRPVGIELCRRSR